MACYLITGGCGFIGRHLTHHLLEQGHQVRIIDNLAASNARGLPRSASFTQGDCRSQMLLEEHLQDVDGVFHLAATVCPEHARRHPTLAHDMTFSSTLALLQCLQRVDQQKRIRLVYASSAEVYGDTNGRLASEDTPCQPLNRLATDKYCGELHVRAFAREFSRQAISVRLFNIYGPGASSTSHSDGVIARFACSLAQGRPFLVDGSGQQVRDYLYIDDAIRLLVSAMQHADTQGQAINGCSGTGFSVNHIVRMLSHHKFSVVIQAPARQSDSAFLVGDPGLMYSTLGNWPLTSLEVGLEKTFQHYLALAKHKGHSTLDSGEGTPSATTGNSSSWY